MALTFLADDSRHRFWSITDNGDHRGVTVDLISNRHHGWQREWRHRFPESYIPNVYHAPRWTYENQPILLMQYHLSGLIAVMTVIGIGRHGPVILQQLESGWFDVAYVTSDDGNGDLKSINGDLPLTYHCYDWSLAKSRFIEHVCKTLQNQPEIQQ